MTVAKLPRPTEILAADPSPEARDRFAEAFPGARLYDSADALLAEAPEAGEDDIVVISTPPSIRCKLALQALSTGRHVLCEKPFALDMEEARRMVAEARARKLHIGDCTNRFIGWSLNRKLREMVRSGAVGRPVSLDLVTRRAGERTGIEYQPESRFFLTKAGNGGGIAMDWGVYDWTALVSIFEPVSATVTDAALAQTDVPTGLPADQPYEVETHALATVRFELPDGSSLRINYERSCMPHGDPLELATLQGVSASIDWKFLPFDTEAVLRKRVRRSVKEADEEIIPADPYPEGEGWLSAPLLEFDRLIHGDQNALAWADDQILHSFGIVQAIYEAAETGRPVAVALSKGGRS